MSPPEPSRPAGMFRALRHRNFRLFFAAQCVSVTGTWMQSVAQQWLVYRLTNSAALLGVVTFASQIPVLFVAPLAGVFADRHDKRRIVIGSQAVAMVQSSLLAALVLTGVVRPWHIVALAALLGLTNAFDIPTRQSFIIEMVGKDDLPNAIALNSSMFNAARFFGPAIAGIIIAAWGEGPCFLWTAASFLFVIGALLAMRMPPRERAATTSSILGELREGLAYVRHHTPVAALLLLLGYVGLTAVPLMALLPVFARDVLQGGPRTLGILVSSLGLGAFLAAVRLARRGTLTGLGRLTGLAALSFGVLLVAVSFSRWLPLSMALLFCVGFSMMTQMTSTNTLVQNLVDHGMRGRAMAFYAAIFIGSAPIGSLVAGTAAEWLGAPATVAIGGTLCTLGAVAFLRALPALRREGLRRFVAAGGIEPTEAPI